VSVKRGISRVPCDSVDRLKVGWHQGGDNPGSQETCFTNAGTETFACGRHVAARHSGGANLQAGTIFQVGPRWGA
jgi:hypothetical protein